MLILEPGRFHSSWIKWSHTGVAVANDNTFGLNRDVKPAPSARRQVDVQANTAICRVGKQSGS
jgi:hypothetical protein